jgi:protocatechuate 3,4-dioxygenase beta subunit
MLLAYLSKFEHDRRANVPPEQQDEHDFGLQHDLATTLARMPKRRKVLEWMLAGGSALVVGGCGGSSSPAPAPSSNPSGGTQNPGGDFSGNANQVGNCIRNQEETAGPYPGDGSNTVNGQVSNVLNEFGVVRSDIRSSFAISANVAQGVPFTLRLKLLNHNNNCVPLTNYAVYLWHCTRDGEYSLYANALQSENYLRGVQLADSNGELTFRTIVPGCYPGRYPHFHFEVYPSLAMASLYTNKIQTSQIALPSAIVNAVYDNAAGYGPSATNLVGLTIQNDSIFGNNSGAQIDAMTATVTGSLTNGYTGTLVIGVPGL